MPQLTDDWQLRYGARVTDGAVEFRAWAPRVESLSVRLAGEGAAAIAMEPRAGGEFSLTLPGVPAAADYSLVLPGGQSLPDPVSRWQPHGVHGPSRTVDPSDFHWTDGAWKGIPLEDYLIYELHTAAFTSEGTFDGIIPKLGHLRDLGITALELMPVAEFPGTRNWGYDGVCLYAPHSAYGGPSGLKRLADACHRAGLALVLDVVYNHLGPEGNYLARFGPYFTRSYRTPWGEAVNFDGPESGGVRRFFIDNALYWLTEYHADALRLDAVHGIFDFSAHHILDELGAAFHEQAGRLGRAAYLIAESDLNDVRVINPRPLGGYQIDAQWSDDFHHSLHTLLAAPREEGYLTDFGKLEDLVKAIREGFVYDGRYSAYRRRRHGSSSKDRPGRQFVVAIQNHDQVANACGGRRLAQMAGLEAQKLAAAVLLCAPFLPLLFMGEEYAEIAPFLYFTSHTDPALAEAVRKGRAAEMAVFAGSAEFHDPQSEAAFERSRLDWTLPERPPHSHVLRLYRDLIALRKSNPCLSNCRQDLVTVEFDEPSKWLVMERSDPAGSMARLACNFSNREVETPARLDGDAWRLALWTAAPEYGGPAGVQPPGQPRLVLPALTAALFLNRQD